MAKVVTLQEADTKRLQAAQLMERLGNYAAAEEFESMDPSEYAERRGLVIAEQNPRRTNMARKTYAQLQAELDEANSYISELEDKVDAIADLVADEDDQDDIDEDDGDEDGDEDED